MVRLFLMLLVLLMGSTPCGHASAAGSRPESGERLATRELEPDLVKKTIQRYLEGVWRERVKAIQVTMEPSESIRIPSGIIELQVSPAQPNEGLGRRIFHIAVTVNGKLWKIIDVLTDVAALVDVVVPSRYLKAEELIDAEDLTTSKVKVLDFKHPFIMNPEEVIGMSAARPLQVDMPIRQGFLKKPFLIKKGDRVMIEARRGGLSIQTSGVTKSSGQVGQSIMVANQDSGRELRAKVVAPGLVQVEF